MKDILAVFVSWLEFALGCPAAIPPLELHYVPWYRGPSFIDINSAATQFAGRTTLNSGSTTVVVSTTNVRSDSLVFLSMLGNANVASGQNRVTEVKTISDSGYFTIGTQDGVAIARNTVIMWEVKLPGKTV